MHMPAYYFRMEDIKWREKWTAAAHEAGHATVAYEKGMAFVRAWLYPNETNAIDEKSWLGKMTWMLSPGNEHNAVIGVAGIVAEALRENPDVDADEILWDWDDGNLMPSDTDMANVPDDVDTRFDLVTKALGILRNQKRLFDAITRHLFSDEYLSDGDLNDLAKEHLI